MPTLTLSKSNFFSNLSLLKNAIHPNIALVIKDNAYGHGLLEIASLALEFGIDSVFVKNNAEAAALNAAFEGRFAHITILYPSDFSQRSFSPFAPFATPANLPPLSPNIPLNLPPTLPPNIHFAASSLESIAQMPPNASLELKINTGMNRNGIEPSDLAAALELIKQRGLGLVGVFTHNAHGDCDESCSGFAAQMARFAAIKAQVRDFCAANQIPLPRFHSLSSSGALKCPNVDDDLVRIGIAAYGYLCAPHPLRANLAPVAALWADKIAQRTLKRGEKVGYEGKGGGFAQDCVVSSYDVGYGDGLPRLNESHAPLFTKEGFLILPRMSMDCVSIVSEAPKVCVMGDAEAFARAFGTISYEILCKISPTIRREIIA